MSWSRTVHHAHEARAVLASPVDVLDLRACAWLDAAWAALGAHEVAAGELAVPVPQRLVGVEQTRALGERLGRGLRAGDLVLLSGPLGAGKTALTQGIGAALQVRGAVTSPTFVLARVHRGRVPLVHVDAYRLREAGARLELDDLDLDAALEDAVTVVEWGEGLAAGLAASWLEVELERPAAAGAQDDRVVRVRAHGPRWSSLQQS